MCARQHTFHSRGSLLPTRENTDGVSRIPLCNPRLPISVLELTKNEVVGGGVVTGSRQDRLCCHGLVYYLQKDFFIIKNGIAHVSKIWRCFSDSLSTRESPD